VPRFNKGFVWGQSLHVAHRLVAFALLAMVFWLVALCLRTGVDVVVRRAVQIAAGLVVVQIVLGALNVWWALRAWSVVPHMVVGASLWTALVVAAVTARWQAAAGARSETERLAVRAG
jgi:heme A synthase